MNDTQKSTLSVASNRLAFASEVMQAIDDSFAQSCSDIVETGIFDYEEGSVFADDVASLETFQMEFEVLVRTARRLKDTFANYAREGYEDHATA